MKFFHFTFCCSYPYLPPNCFSLTHRKACNICISKDKFIPNNTHAISPEISMPINNKINPILSFLLVTLDIILFGNFSRSAVT